VFQRNYRAASDVDSIDGLRVGYSLIGCPNGSRRKKTEAHT
jgi:hypothetical protein